MRELKGGQAAQGDLEEALTALFALKEQYRTLTGQDFRPPGNKKSKKPKAGNKSQEFVAASPAAGALDSETTAVEQDTGKKSKGKGKKAGAAPASDKKDPAVESEEPAEVEPSQNIGDGE